MRCSEIPGERVLQKWILLQFWVQVKWPQMKTHTCCIGMCEWESYHINLQRWERRLFPGSRDLQISPGRIKMHIWVLHSASLWIVFWGQLGPTGVREDCLAAGLHIGVFLSPVQHLNGIHGDSDKCIRSGNLVSVTGLLVTWESSKGELLWLLESEVWMPLEIIWSLPGRTLRLDHQ
jgi:hypothetical protein